MKKGAMPIETAPQSLTASEWRAAMGCFPSGVTVVTTWRGAEPVGATVNAFCSVSLEPPLLLVCLALASPALGPIEASGVMGVNILDAGCAHLAMRFGRKPEENRFAGLGYGAVEGGAPHLEAAAVFVDCALESAHDAGDHKILVGRGLRISHNSAAPPLLYHRGAFPEAL